jgi:hypothetical protein
MVDGLMTMHLQNYKASGAELIMGNGRLPYRQPRKWINQPQAGEGVGQIGAA